MARRRFIIIAAKALTLVNELHELADYAPRMCADEAIKDAADKLDVAYVSLRRFMDGNMP